MCHIITWYVMIYHQMAHLMIWSMSMWWYGECHDMWWHVMIGQMARHDMCHVITSTWHVMTFAISSHRHGTSWHVPYHHIDMVRHDMRHIITWYVMTFAISSNRHAPHHHIDMVRHDMRHIITSTWHTAHWGDQTENIWISRSTRFPGRSFGWREPNLLRWNLDWNCRDSRENMFDAYGDSSENLLEMLVVVMI